MYNNKSWEALCNTPGKDRDCSLCFDPNVDIRPPSHGAGACDGNCWERDICIKYRWGCTPQGKKFGRRAYEGMKVFFVYKQLDRNYTLWGKTTVQSIDDKLTPSFDGKYYQFMNFTPFEALPKDKWVRGLTNKQLVGQQWRQGRFRYVDTGRESYLEQLIQGGGGEAENLPEGPIINPPLSSTTLNIKIMPNIDEKLEEIAYKEGRQKDEIVREALAEWLKGREI